MTLRMLHVPCTRSRERYAPPCVRSLAWPLQTGLAQQRGEVAEEASRQLHTLRAAHDCTCAELQRKVMLLTAISRMASKAAGCRAASAGQLQQVRMARRRDASAA